MMNKQQIEKWGYEADNHADVVIAMPGEYHPDWHVVRDEYFASLVAAHEREQCEMLARNRSLAHEDAEIRTAHWTTCQNIANAIRERGNQQFK